MSEISKCNANETAACCCVDVGRIMDNSDCATKYENSFASQAEAEKMLATLTEKARAVESDPCQISHTITQTADGYLLVAEFTFACEAELLIFQLGLR
jgi:uncharacterized protein (TIGR00743 family)